MREEKVTYSELQFHSPNQQQRRKRQEASKTKESGCCGQQGCSVPLHLWKLIALVLLVICVVLLVLLGIFALKLTEKQSGNLTSSQETSLEECNSVGGCQPCEDNWYQHGKYCYFDSKSPVHWNQCSFQCSTRDSCFLEFNTEKEMDFVKRLTKMLFLEYKRRFWIYEEYNKMQEKQTLSDDSALDLKKINTSNDQCNYIENGVIQTGDCRELGYCMCKKTIY